MYRTKGQSTDNGNQVREREGGRNFRKTGLKRAPTEVGIYNRKQESKKESKHAFDQESDEEKKEENDIGREKKRKKERSRPRK